MLGIGTGSRDSRSITPSSLHDLIPSNSRSNSQPDPDTETEGELEPDTIDELTLALNNFSRVPSPDSSSESSSTAALTCCCKRQEECEHFKAWMKVKGRLENRLTLSAEIGQALLQRHEAYVRRHENCDTGDERLSEVLREKHALEKRLTQALVNNEVTEVSSKTLHQELQEARTMISRLSANHAKSIGWETRLNVINKEKDDIQQERDFESQRARLAESRFAALKEKSSKLQSEVRRLQNELEEKRLSRMETTESLLKDARSRIQVLHATIGSPSTSTSETSELTKVLESLVDDNEGLKRDNAELQTLLAESRDDLYVLQQEVEETRATNISMGMNPRSGSRAATPIHGHFGRTQQTHHHSGSMPNSFIREQLAPLLNRRNSSLERKGLRPPEPLTPDTLMTSRDLPPVSPYSTYSESASAHGGHGSGRPNTHAPLPPSPYQVEFSESGEGNESGQEKARSHRPLYLLTRSRAVQTDALPAPVPLLPSAFYSAHPPTTGGLLSPSPIPTSPSTTSPATIPIPTPSPDPRSECSSFSESSSSNPNGASNMSILIERMSALQTRMNQADALTLTNRLKRQHLLPSSSSHSQSHTAHISHVSHLSRSTISSIQNDLTLLRTSFRPLLEDENTAIQCTRKDLRGLFKLFREVFLEWGNLRRVMNDIVLDPGSASRVSELALDPAKAEKEAQKVREREREKERERDRDGGGGTGWMAPISKLFGGSAGSAALGRTTDASAGPEPAGGATSPAAAALGGLTRSTSSRAPSHTQRPRLVPKLQPALSASATTVNVEFSSGVGRSVSSSTPSSTFASRQNSTMSTSTFSTSNYALGSASNYASAGPSRQQTQIGSIGNDNPTLGGGAHVGSSASSSVMGIFAGAPIIPDHDPWVVIPNVPRDSRRQSTLRPGFNPVGLGVNPDYSNGLPGNRLPRNVDAVIDEVSARSPLSPTTHREKETGDEEEEDVVTPLVPRALRRRGLSDSSLRSTYMSEADEDEGQSFGGFARAGPAWTRGSVLEALSRRVQSFKSGISDVLPSSSLVAQVYDDRRLSAGPGSNTNTSASIGAGSRNALGPRSSSQSRAVSKSGLSGYIPDISNTISTWGIAADTFDPNFANTMLAASSPRDESPMLRSLRGRER